MFVCLLINLNSWSALQHGDDHLAFFILRRSFFKSLDSHCISFPIWNLGHTRPMQVRKEKSYFCFKALSSKSIVSFHPRDVNTLTEPPPLWEQLVEPPLPLYRLLCWCRTSRSYSPYIHREQPNGSHHSQKQCVVMLRWCELTSRSSGKLEQVLGSLFTFLVDQFYGGTGKPVLW